jgi:hypothetical protein
MAYTIKGLAKANECETFDAAERLRVGIAGDDGKNKVTNKVNK